MIKGLTEVIAFIMMIIQSLTNYLPEAVLIKEKVTITNPVIEIPAINLKKEFYPNDKIKNNVDKGIEVIEGSSMPNVKNGNLILASHSGNSVIAYFKNLDKLKINDSIYVYYQDRKYKYVIADTYDIEKTGYAKIKRDKNKTSITLVTCKKHTSQQTLYIGYLILTAKT